MFRNSGKLTSSQNSNSSSCNKENFNHVNLSSSSSTLIEIKSKFDAEFRRFSLQRSDNLKFNEFYKLIEHFHRLFDIEFSIFYQDPILGDLLPINNDDNFAKAISSAKPTLKLIIQRKGESWENFNGVNSKKKHFLGNLGLNNLLPSTPNKMRPSISMPEDFRQVSAIIDVDIVPDTCRRVRLVKHGSEKPLGFYIRDGTSLRVTPNGIEKVPGIFISRLVPGGLAESTGLLAVNDEVLEVNCIQVNGKTLDQVTDMMVANSSNLIITIRPANQRNFNLPSQHSISSHSAGGPSPSGSSSEQAMRNSAYRASQNSQESGSRNDSVQSVSDEDDEDEVKDHFNNNSSNKNTTTNHNAIKTNSNSHRDGVAAGKTIVTSATINTIASNNCDSSNNNSSNVINTENGNHNESEDDDSEDVVRL